MIPPSGPGPGSLPVSTLAAGPNTSPGITAASLHGLLKKLNIEPEPSKVEPGWMSGVSEKKTYKLDPKQAEALFNDPAVKGNTASLVKAMMHPSGPSIVLENVSVARLAWHLGADAKPNLDAGSKVSYDEEVAFEELTKWFGETPLFYEVQRFFNAGKAGEPLPEFVEPEEGELMR